MNTSLPIYEYRRSIVTAVNENAVTIITAETGSGKSTQVCQFLFEEGYEVVITEPRRLAAKTLAERVAEELNEEVGGRVGYRTAFEGETSKDTKILFCTDGLQLVRALVGGEGKKNTVLIIDEVHEWNINIETLVAWTKFQVENGWNVKVVIMSATLETATLQEYFGEAVVMSVPGRMFPVKRTELGKEEFIPTILKLATAGKNVLAFVAGKKEIDETINSLKNRELDAVILPLHGELSSIEQKQCFLTYSKVKVVVATNVAQTSVTVPDIDAVVDTGVEKRIETDQYGVEGLFFHDISKADCDQRQGRAGRTKEGEYYLCSCCNYNDREEYQTAEIQRTILDQVVLRLAWTGIDATELKFFHQPSIESLVLAKRSLTNLGALKDNEITETGKKMARMPISAKYARMIIEAEKYGVVEDVITIAAILECGSLIDYRSGKGYHDFSDKRDSDLLAELDIWNNLAKHGFIDFKKEGINQKNFFKIKELRNKLSKALLGIVEFGTQSNHELIKKACIAGMVDSLYKTDMFRGYIDAYGEHRSLDKKSRLYYRSPQLLIGKPITIQYKDRWGCMSEMNLICMATEVKHEWLEEVAPQLISTRESNPEYSPDLGCYVYRDTYFNGLEIGREIVQTPNHPEAESLRMKFEEEEKARARIYEDSGLWYSAKKDEKQLEINIEGRDFYISYDWNGNPSITVDKEFLKTVSVKSAKLDNGKKVTICCGFYSADNFPALAGKIEMDERKNAWIEKRRSLGDIHSTSEKVVIGWFDKLGKTLITKRWDGRPIYAFVYLALENNSISLNMTKDEELANSETESALNFLLGRIVKSRYPDKKFQVKKSIGKTKVKSEEKALFDELVRDAADGISPDNFSERINMLDEFFKELVG